MNIRIIKPKSKKDLLNLKGKVIALGGNDKINRLITESKAFMLLDPEPKGKDFMHSKNSGLNQVLCNLANKNKVSIGFNINKIINSTDQDKISIISKILQNVKLCLKYKVNLYIVNIIEAWSDERDTKDLKSFGAYLGIPPNKVNILKIKND